MNKLLKMLLKTGVYYLDQAEEATATIRHRVRNGVDAITDRAELLRRSREGHTLRHAISFAAGIGLGVSAGLLFAPASGNHTREALTERLQDFRDSVGKPFSSKMEKGETGAES
jgi:YtxH-like protein